MLSKTKVYWASPLEVAALPNTTKNMITNNLVKTRFVLDKILDYVHSGDKVGVKVHVGEAHNTRYLRPDFVREVVESIKSKGGIPTLIETQGRGNNLEQIEIHKNYTIFVGYRKKAIDHKKIAHLHGYIESIIGTKLYFIDGEHGIDRKIVKINGIHFKEVSVAKELFKFDKLVVVSHFKGHPLAGFGGALKQLGMGCVSKHNKIKAHFDGDFVVNINRCDTTKCNQECITFCPLGAIRIKNNFAEINHSICHGCFRCTLKCPVKEAIKAPLRRNNKEFVECFIDNAKAVLSFGAEKISYINFAFDIPLMCDCVPNASVPVVPDLGIFGSYDPVALDKACVDAETNAPSIPFLDKEGQWTKPLEPGIEKFSALNPMVNSTWQIDAAVKNKLGSKDYELVRI
ncbi:MAG: DUF362 domain-containing protein [Candidatus Hermodarchaeota archaeon]